MEALQAHLMFKNHMPHHNSEPFRGEKVVSYSKVLSGQRLWRVMMGRLFIS
jgi:hypothetical protein